MYDFKDDLKQTESAIEDNIEALANRVLANIIIPFCNKNKYKFITHNGAYGFFKLSEESIDNNDLPKEISSIFECSIVGTDYFLYYALHGTEYPLNKEVTQ